MFKNIGGKIMTLASILCWIGIFCSVFLGILFIILAIFLENQPIVTLVYGIILLIFGPLFSWINSFVLYGFGRLIENSEIIANRDC